MKVSTEGRVALHYPFAPALVEAARDALVTMARIQFAAGAREVVSLHHEPLRLRHVGEVERLRAAPFAALDHTVFSAHQMGGCAMGRSPAHAVTNEDGRVFGAQNVWVMDGSLFPTSLGVNPQLTIYALAKVLAERLHAAG
ncbi:MAG: GMC family oxidoreductase [Myxococcales bacterium]|nr:GMC family oxidoreductase [Myxococcales bacterium]